MINTDIVYAVILLAWWLGGFYGIAVWNEEAKERGVVYLPNTASDERQAHAPIFVRVVLHVVLAIAWPFIYLHLRFLARRRPMLPTHMRVELEDDDAGRIARDGWDGTDGDVPLQERPVP